MANSSNKIVVPNAREAMDRFKMEAAGEVGVSLKQGYNGDISAKQAGSIGGQMVKNVLTVRLTKKASFERENRIVDGHKQRVRYIAGIAI
ncbi:MAG: alpha/beta-type small acid-soluble spore protein [Oscillospiraceae bacterium]|nr:alpha/beta-type small acid-soluble spore protein [Oscillospiraceae bacterium]